MVLHYTECVKYHFYTKCKSVHFRCWQCLSGHNNIMNRLSHERRTQVIRALVEGNSIRATCWLATLLAVPLPNALAWFVVAMAQALGTTAASSVGL